VTLSSNNIIYQTSKNTIMKQPAPIRYYIKIGNTPPELVDAADLICRGYAQKAAGGDLDYCAQGETTWHKFNSEWDSTSANIKPITDTNTPTTGNTATTPEDEDPEDCRTRIRNQTCYPGLRTTINITSLIMTILSLIAGGTILISSNGRTTFITWGIIQLITGPIVINILLHMLHLMIDIPDILIEQTRRKQQKSPGKN
jgi:hypothetical protein